MVSTRSVNLNIRIHPREKKRWHAAARRNDEKLSEWVRSWLNRAAMADSDTETLALRKGIETNQIEAPLNGRSKRRSA